MRSRILVALVATLALPAPAAAMKHLVVLLDDCGYDAFGTFGVSDAPSTPTLDALAGSGVTFRNAWSNPMCSPTRASLLTGQYARDHGRTSTGAPPVNPAGPSLPRAAAEAGLVTWHTGKWHLGDVETLPAELGFASSVGPKGNLSNEDYFSFEVYRDGERETVTTYATTWTVDEALARIEAADGNDWLGYVAFNAPHAPFHDPPCELHGYGCDPLPDDFTRYRAAVAAVDTELTRLFAALPADTMIYLTCDNGTPEAVVSPSAPFRGAKGQPTEGGVHVPLIVAGPAVGAGNQGSDSEAMVHVIDLFATIAALEEITSGVPAAGVDLSRYLADPGAPSERDWMTAERFGDNLPFARALLYADRWKLAWDDPEASPRFHDLATDPMELVDLAPGGDTSGLDAEQLEAHASSFAVLEETPQCADRRDNDRDGARDLLDPECEGLWGRLENADRSCGLGFEVILALPLWGALHRRAGGVRRARHRHEKAAAG